MEEKLAIIRAIFSEATEEDSNIDAPPNAPIVHGKYYGGVYKGRKYMYSDDMIRILSKEKLEATIKKQIGFV